VPHVSPLRRGFPPHPKFIDHHHPPRYPELLQVTLQYAAEHLAELTSAARRGEEVEIAQPDEPPIKLVVSTHAPRKPKSPRVLGAGVVEMTVPSCDEWKAVDKELEREANKAPLVSGEA
jgi:antitoxin (DNA-binding transcriptional repressor) of toxin-antitoxin stability system